MRKIALDVGDKTVGIALSDELGITAQGLTTLERVGIRKDTGKILDLVKEYGCDTIVIGLPLSMSGTDSPQTEKVREFRTMIENKMRSTGMKDIEVVWQDERLTTVMAERVLIDADVSRKKRKDVIDKQAAVLIMCVNDIICVGARPLFFLDYIAVGKNYPEKVAQIVKGVADGCVQSESALIGGETAEMPGFYPEDEYDLAGFSVGVVDKSKVLDKNSIKEGDVLIGLPSSGVHSNGFSLVRKVLDVENSDIKTPLAELGGKSIGETLLTPTKIYVKPMLNLFSKVTVKSVAHITGGGFYENIPRSLPDGFGVKIRRENVKVLPIFDLIAKRGGIPERDMFNTFNMGVGMTAIVAPEDADRALAALKEAGEDAYVLGSVVRSEERVEIC